MFRNIYIPILSFMYRHFPSTQNRKFQPMIDSHFMRLHSIKPFQDGVNWQCGDQLAHYRTDDFIKHKEHEDGNITQDIRFRFEICSAAIKNTQLPMSYMRMDITKMQLNCPLGLSLLVATIQSQLSEHGGKYISWITPTTPLAQIQLSL